MNANRMLEIAAQLAALYKTRTELSLREWQYEKDAEARRLYITPPPPEGWPGKNAEERKTSADRYFAADEVLGKITAAASLVHVELAQTEALIAGLEAERRALEYTVKISLVETLLARHVEYATGQDAFEQVEDVELDQAAFEYADESPF